MKKGPRKCGPFPSLLFSGWANGRVRSAGDEHLLRQRHRGVDVEVLGLEVHELQRFVGLRLRLAVVARELGVPEADAEELGQRLAELGDDLGGVLDAGFELEAHHDAVVLRRHDAVVGAGGAERVDRHHGEAVGHDLLDLGTESGERHGVVQDGRERAVDHEVQAAVELATAAVLGQVASAGAGGQHDQVQLLLAVVGEVVVVHRSLQGSRIGWDTKTPTRSVSVLQIIS